MNSEKYNVMLKAIKRAEKFFQQQWDRGVIADNVLLLEVQEAIAKGETFNDDTTEEA